MVSKVAVLVVSVMLVVGVIIVLSMVMGGGPYQQLGPNNRMGSSMKMVTSICELTKYKGPCARSLEPAAKNATATSKNYILAALEATFNALDGSSEATADVPVHESNNKYNHGAIKDCKRFMGLARERLRTSIAIVRGTDSLNSLDADGLHELRSWMTAVYALHTSCLDQILDPQPRMTVQIAIKNSTELSHNAVNIMAELAQILKLFGENGGSSSVKKMAASLRHPRSLISGYPAWFKGADRRVLQQQQQQLQTPKPDVVVAQDGTGRFTTIEEAVAAYPANHKGRFVIYVKAGVYEEQVLINNDKPNIFMYGDGIGKTVVTGDQNFGKMRVGTMHTATFANEATGFIAQGMTLRNKAGPEGLQAVAFRSMGDMSALFDCSIEGYQDTLFYQLYRQFYRNCLIYGTVDIIFGKGEAVIQDSEIIVRKPMSKQTNTVTADGREIQKGTNGLVLQNCRIVPEKEMFPNRFEIPTYLGRPWMPEALTVVMQSELGDFIRPEGWKVLDGTHNHKSCRVYEYTNRGPGAGTCRRSKNFANFKVLKANEAANYTPGQFLGGARWLPQTSVPCRLTL